MTITMRILAALFTLIALNMKAQTLYTPSGLVGTVTTSSPGVGIFTTDPAAALDIRTTYMNGLRVEHTVGGDYGFGILLRTNRDLTKAFSHFNNTSEDFIIWGNGVVNATKIYSKEIEVRADAMGIFWPDYVFSPTYELRSIPALCNYVNEYHHLPDFPAADCLDESGGYDLTHTITSLLSTIEQQALYIIELNDRITALEAAKHTKP